MDRAAHSPARNPFDPLLFTMTLLLAIGGLPILYSASYAEGIAEFNSSSHFVVRQAGYVVVGLLLLWWASTLSLVRLRRNSRFLLLGAVGLMVVCLFQEPVNGACRWLRLGPLTLQPSELGKLALIVYLASYLAKCREWVEESWVPVMHVGLMLALVGAVLFMQPHVSALCLVFGVALTLVVLSGLPKQRLASLLCVMTVAGLFVYAAAPEEQRNRVRVWIGLEQSRAEEYQQRQSDIALERGGLFGVGFCEGRQKLRYLPESHSDFIFSCLAEELGFVGVLFTMGCFSVLIWKCYDVAHKCDSQFAGLMCSGIGMLLSLQCLAHVGVATGVLPTTGVTLPLLSAGGSALVSTLFAIGLVLNVSRGVEPEVDALDDEDRAYRRGNGRARVPAARTRRHGALA